MALKIGDRVRVVAPVDGAGSWIGAIGVVEKNDQSGHLPILFRADDGLGTRWGEEGSFELLAKTREPIIKKTMKTLNAMMKKLLDADTQKLVKAGLINGDLEVTEAGSVELRQILFLEKKAELVARAEEIIKESEEK